MELLNNIGDALSTTAEIAKEKAIDIAQVTKLKYEIKKSECFIRHLYTEIGKKCYHLQKNGEDLTGKLERYYQKIEEQESLIAAAKKKLTLYTNTVFCENCGQPQKGIGDFCPYCGAKRFGTVENTSDEEDFPDGEDEEISLI